MPGKVILGFTKERTFELGLDKRVRVFQVNVGEDLYMQKKRHLQKHNCFEGPIMCLTVEGCAAKGESQRDSER